MKKRRLPDGENIEERLETLISRIGEKVDCCLCIHISVGQPEIAHYILPVHSFIVCIGICPCWVFLIDFSLGGSEWAFCELHSCSPVLVFTPHLL